MARSIEVTLLLLGLHSALHKKANLSQMKYGVDLVTMTLCLLVKFRLPLNRIRTVLPPLQQVALPYTWQLQPRLLLSRLSWIVMPIGNLDSVHPTVQLYQMSCMY